MAAQGTQIGINHQRENFSLYPMGDFGNNSVKKVVSTMTQHQFRDRMAAKCSHNEVITTNMKFIHYNLNLKSNDAVQVHLDKQANVRLLDDHNFQNYRRGGRHTYYGGLATHSPYIISPPRAGHWHLVVDLGGYSGTISASVQII